MEINLVSEGFKFMALGMGAVFLFLIIMVFVLKFQAYIITKFFTCESVVAPVVQQKDKAVLVAVMSAAIEAFRKDQK